MISSTSLADWGVPDCGEMPRLGRPCVERGEILHPTQMAIGYRMVQEKKDELQGMSREDRHAYLLKKVVPVILGPGGRRYLIDRHHLVRAVLESGFTKVVISVLGNYKNWSQDRFQAAMEEHGYLHLYDENGEGPLPFTRLRETVLDLPDDDYRSLASAVRKAGGFKKTRIPFAEFEWANHFRRRIPKSLLDEDFMAAVRRGVDLARHADAQRLPGFIPIRRQCSDLFLRLK